MSPITYEEIPVTTLASGQVLTLPLHRITGAKTGPTVGITALIHGEELVPNAVQQEVYRLLDPEKMCGTVLMLPVANPFSYEAQTRHTPTDGLNLNRVFPGSPNGMITEQIADAIATKFLPQIDYLIDLHGGGVFPTVDYVYLSNIKPEMSKAFGSKMLYLSEKHAGTVSSLAEERGIPAMVAELGGGLLLDDKYIARGTEGVLNVLKHLDVIEGTPVLPEKQVIVKNMAIVRPKNGGSLYPVTKLDALGTIIPGGTVLARVVSPYTFQELEVLRAPFDRNYVILARGSVVRCNPGDFGYMMADASDAE